VTLRTEGEPRRGAGIDPAHQSLADALRLVFRGLQVAMVALLVVFAFSGVQKVNENEKGIKLLFGRPMGDELPPGPQFAAPYPFGELVKVPTGLERLDVSETFWPKLTADQQGLSVEKLAAFNRPTLKPGEDGMNITGDSNVAHTRWQVQFVRARPSEWARNIIKEEEAGIVRAAVERGVVHALAEVKIDDLLRQTGGDQGSVARKAQAVAQKMLDDIQSGIHIEQLTLQEKSPPFFAYSAFAGVQAAEQKAGEKRIAAQSQARTTLNAMAGGAQEGLIRAIDAYEKAAALGDTPAQQKLMEAIDTILDGKAADVEGAKVPEGVAAGRVTALLLGFLCAAEERNGAG
jgi:membrane protease subunit HflK